MKTSLSDASLAKRVAALILGIALVALLLWRWSGAGTEAETPKRMPPSGAASAQALTMEIGNTSAASRERGGSRCERALMHAFNDRSRVLGRRPDAASQLAYALAVPFDQVPDIDRMQPSELQRIMARRQLQADQALLRAAALAPEQPGVLFLAAAQCGAGAACRGVQQALLAAEPDNMAAWLMEMGWARLRDDQEGGRIAFEQAAQATRYDTHADTRLQVMVDAYGDSPLPAECSSKQEQAAMRRETGMRHDFGVLDQALLLANASRALPAYIDISRQCVPQTSEAVAEPRRAACRKILARMADGDTLIEQSIALGAMVQLLADAPEASAWRQRYREHHWMLAQMADTSVHSMMRMEDYALEEVRAYRALLEAAGRWPPPIDWLPADEHARSLFQTGRPPPKPPR